MHHAAFRAARKNCGPNGAECVGRRSVKTFEHEWVRRGTEERRRAEQLEGHEVRRSFAPSEGGSWDGRLARPGQSSRLVSCAANSMIGAGGPTSDAGRGCRSSRSSSAASPLGLHAADRRDLPVRTPWAPLRARCWGIRVFPTLGVHDSVRAGIRAEPPARRGAARAVAPARAGRALGQGRGGFLRRQGASACPSRRSRCHIGMSASRGRSLGIEAADFERDRRALARRYLGWREGTDISSGRGMIRSTATTWWSGCGRRGGQLPRPVPAARAPAGLSGSLSGPADFADARRPGTRERPGSPVGRPDGRSRRP
jgi:hypothetical protein